MISSQKRWPVDHEDGLIVEYISMNVGTFRNCRESGRLMLGTYLSCE
jgi:hypothetical protein